MSLGSVLCEEDAPRASFVASGLGVRVSMALYGRPLRRFFPDQIVAHLAFGRSPVSRVVHAGGELCAEAKWTILLSRQTDKGLLPFAVIASCGG